MELINKDKRDGYIYDPIIKQYDASFWKTTTGTPAMSSNVLRFTSAAAASYLLHMFADVEFSFTIPTAPTGGDVRQFGFRMPASDALGGVYFDITDTVFSIKVVDNFGVTTTTTPITWSAGWTNKAASYRIRWEKDQINAYVNGVVKATISAPITDIPENALALRIVNGNADNMDLNYLAVRRAASII
jgi:hypothetical protein